MFLLILSLGHVFDLYVPGHARPDQATLNRCPWLDFNRARKRGRQTLDVEAFDAYNVTTLLGGYVKVVPPAFKCRYGRKNCRGATCCQHHGGIKKFVHAAVSENDPFPLIYECMNGITCPGDGTCCKHRGGIRRCPVEAMYLCVSPEEKCPGEMDLCCVKEPVQCRNLNGDESSFLRRDCPVQCPGDDCKREEGCPGFTSYDNVKPTMCEKPGGLVGVCTTWGWCLDPPHVRCLYQEVRDELTGRCKKILEIKASIWQSVKCKRENKMVPECFVWALKV